MFLIKTNN